MTEQKRPMEDEKIAEQIEKIVDEHPTGRDVSKRLAQWIVKCVGESNNSKDTQRLEEIYWTNTKRQEILKRLTNAK